MIKSTVEEIILEIVFMNLKRKNSRYIKYIYLFACSLNDTEQDYCVRNPHTI